MTATTGGRGIRCSSSSSSAEEALFDVGFRHAAHGVAELGGHQLGGVGVDDVVDLQHHALTHQELDDVDAADGHPVGQLLHGDDVGDDDFAGRRGAARWTPPLRFSFSRSRARRTEASERIRSAASLVAGHGLDGQAAFAALGLALGAADGLAGVRRETLVAIVLGRAGGRAGRRARGWDGAHFGRGRRRVGVGRPPGPVRGPPGRAAPGAGRGVRAE